MSETDWKINKTSPQCQLCGTPFAPESAFFSALIQEQEGMRRSDCCEACFHGNRPANLFYFWKTTLPKVGQTVKKARPVLDFDNVLDFFKRLEGESGPQRVAFRYILALMLSRKKILVQSEKKKNEQGQTVQYYREKTAGADTLVHAVIEPDLSEEEIQALSAELGVLLGIAPAATEPPAPEASLPTVNESDIIAPS